MSKDKKEPVHFTVRNIDLKVIFEGIGHIYLDRIKGNGTFTLEAGIRDREENLSSEESKF